MSVKSIVAITESIKFLWKIEWMATYRVYIWINEWQSKRRRIGFLKTSLREPCKSWLSKIVLLNPGEQKVGWNSTLEIFGKMSTNSFFFFVAMTENRVKDWKYLCCWLRWFHEISCLEVTFFLPKLHLEDDQLQKSFVIVFINLTIVSVQESHSDVLISLCFLFCRFWYFPLWGKIEFFLLLPNCKRLKDY